VTEIEVAKCENQGSEFLFLFLHDGISYYCWITEKMIEQYVMLIGKYGLRSLNGETPLGYLEDRPGIWANILHVFQDNWRIDENKEAAELLPILT